MTFSEAVHFCLREKLFTTSGRAARSEYWWFALFNLTAIVGILLVATVVLGETVGIFLAGATGLLLLIPSLTVAIRRLHDRNMSGWWLLLAFIPNIGQLALFVLYALPGTTGPNRFGPDPLGDDTDWPDDDDTGLSPSSIPRVDRE